MADIADIGRRTILRFDGQVVQFGDRHRTVVEFDVVFELTDLGRASRNDLVLRGNRGFNVLSGQSLGLKRLRIEIDLNLPLFPAIGRRNSGPLNGCQRRAYGILPEIVNLLFR